MTGSREKTDAAGNWAAHHWARAAVAYHPPPPLQPPPSQSWRSFRRGSEPRFGAIGPVCYGLRICLAWLAGQRRDSRDFLTHDWRPVREAGPFHCARCQATARRITPTLAAARCCGSSRRGSLASVLESPAGHPLIVCYSEGAPPCVACTRCGAFAQSRPKKLLRPCPSPARCRAAGIAGSQPLARIAKGRHPATGALLIATRQVPPVRPNPGAIAGNS